MSTRWEEVRSWGWDEEMIHSFLKLQWTAQQQSYLQQYPRAEHLILNQAVHKVGQARLNRSDIDLTLVDLSLLPAYRNQGIGTSFILKLQTEAAITSKTIYLSVLHDNPSLRLYERLGFQHKQHNGLHVQMEWSSLLIK
ncbi:GNAT family N-acetyltransferase [Paenibacillus pini]